MSAPRRLPQPPTTLLLTWNPDRLVDQPVCNAMAKDFVKAYVKPFDHARFIELASHVCSARRRTIDDAYAVILDYLQGASLAINPLPEAPKTYIDADAHALHDDWLVVRSDTERVWNTCSALRERLRQLDDGLTGTTGTAEVAGTSGAARQE